ncbi:MAG: hypothetical protein MK132_05885 [Lentisphaerales bacterium]|nr:hypothetical protein [Lentisphaerales bacterium]
MNKGLNIQQHLRRTARQSSLNELLLHSIKCLIYIISWHLIFILVDHNFHLQKTARATIFLICFLAPIIYFSYHLYKNLTKKLNLLYIAQKLENKYPSLKNKLFSLLSDLHTLPKTEQAILDEFRKLKPKITYTKELKQLLKVTLALLSIIGLYSMATIKPVSLSVARLYAPIANAPAPSKTRIQNVSPIDNSELYVEKNWRLTIHSSGHSPQDGYIRLRSGKNNIEEYKLIKNAEHKYTCSLPAIGQSLNYDIFLGDAEILNRTVNFTRKPEIRNFSARITPPQYIGSAGKEQNTKIIQALAKSQVKFHLQFDQKVTNVELFWENNYFPLEVNYDKAFTRDAFQINQSGTYRFKITAKNKTYETPDFPIHTSKDLPPKVGMTQTKENHLYLNDNQITIKYACTDDLMLKNIKLQYQLKYAGTSKEIQLHNYVNSTSIIGSYSLDLSKIKNKYNDHLVINLIANDFKPSKDPRSISKPLIIALKASQSSSYKKYKFAAIDKEYGKRESSESIRQRLKQQADSQELETTEQIGVAEKNLPKVQTESNSISENSKKVDPNSNTQNLNQKPTPPSQSQEKQSLSQKNEPQSKNSQNPVQNTQKSINNKDNAPTKENHQPNQNAEAKSNHSSQEQQAAKQSSNSQQAAKQKSNSQQAAKQSSNSQQDFSPETQNDAPATVSQNNNEQPLESNELNNEQALRNLKKKEIEKITLNDKQDVVIEAKTVNDPEDTSQQQFILKVDKQKMDSDYSQSEESLKKNSSKIIEAEIQKFSEEEQEIIDLFNKELRRLERNHSSNK